MRQKVFYIQNTVDGTTKRKFEANILIVPIKKKSCDIAMAF